MRGASGKALSVIRECVDRGRYGVLPHFLHRLDQRGLFWPGVQSLLDSPSSVRFGRRDEWDRDKWLISGRAADGQDLEVVRVLDVDEHGETVVFITVYWKER